MSLVTDINGHTFTLLRDKALYKHDERLLIIADVHLGKARHFRKEGIAIPAEVQQDDYTNLARIFQEIQPVKVYFLGDLFHSTFNRDWHYFTDLIALFPHIGFTLVKGNHDIIDDALFRDINITVEECIDDGLFVYTHEEVERVPRKKINIVGHIHPGVVLSGMARQAVKIPCFYQQGNTLTLPAFGVLTGLYAMERSAGAKVWGVLPDGVQLL